jgi:hypothetical protein
MKEIAGVDRGIGQINADGGKDLLVPNARNAGIGGGLNGKPGKTQPEHGQTA